MSTRGRKAAEQYGQKLPTFPDLESARRALLAQRDADLEALRRTLVSSDAFEPDFRPESLKDLEAWYFELWEADAFEAHGSARAEVERGMAMYFCEILVRHVDGMQWSVGPFAFDPERYEIGVERPGYVLRMQRCTDHFETPNNKRRQSLWRRYKELAG